MDTGPILLQLFQEPPGGSLGCGRNLKLWMFMHVLDPDPKIHKTSSNIQVRNQGHPCQTSSGYDVQWHRDIHPASLDIFTLYLLHPGCIYFRPTYRWSIISPTETIFVLALCWEDSKIIQLTILPSYYGSSLLPDFDQVSASDNKLKASSERQAAKEALYVTIVACILCWWRRRLKDMSFDLSLHCLLQQCSDV